MPVLRSTPPCCPCPAKQCCARACIGSPPSLLSHPKISAAVGCPSSNRPPPTRSTPSRGPAPVCAVARAIFRARLGRRSRMRASSGPSAPARRACAIYRRRGLTRGRPLPLETRPRQCGRRRRCSSSWRRSRCAGARARLRRAPMRARGALLTTPHRHALRAPPQASQVCRRRRSRPCPTPRPRAPRWSLQTCRHTCFFPCLRGRATSRPPLRGTWPAFSAPRALCARLAAGRTHCHRSGGW
jgi:hypothetical protein